MKRYPLTRDESDQTVNVVPNPDGTVNILGGRFKVQKRRYRLITTKDSRIVMKAGASEDHAGPRPLFERILKYRKTNYRLEVVLTYELAD